MKGTLMLGLAACAASLSPAAAQTFGGAYGGVEIGYADGEQTIEQRVISTPEDPPPSIDVGGEAFVYGAFAGIGVRLSPAWYAGGEIGVGAGGEDGSAELVAADASIEPDWRWSVSGRIGYLVDDASLFYAKVGYEERAFDFSFSNGRQESADFAGLLYGAGFERLVGERLSVRAEVIHTDFDGEDFDVTPPPSDGMTFEPSETRLAIGLALRL